MISFNFLKNMVWGCRFVLFRDIENLFRFCILFLGSLKLKCKCICIGIRIYKYLDFKVSGVLNFLRFL